MLAQFREEIESISSQWKDNAKEKAEKIINAALMGSKRAMDSLMQESTNELVQVMKKMLSDSLAEARDLSRQTKKFGWFVLLLSILMLAASCLFMLCFRA